jgi:hypothetical protein
VGSTFEPTQSDYGAESFEWYRLINSTGVGFDRVLVQIKLLGDLAVAHALGNPFKDLKLAARDAELLLFLFVREEGFPGRDRNLLHNDRVLRSCQLEAELDPNSGKHRRGQSSVDFDQMFDYQEAILRPLEDGNQDSTD